MNLKFILTVITLFTFPFLQYTIAQPLEFQRNRQVNVFAQNSNEPLQYPWAGGLNAPQFSTIDLNGDDIQDLFIFDKSTRKIFPFVNQGTENEQDYVYIPEYAFQFPPLADWVLLRDYNADGVADIFTYSIAGAGVSVYLANRPSPKSLSFELVSDRLLYQGLNGKSNILVTRIDIPGIVDVTGDGDLDILTFDAFGNFVEHYENQSQELTGTAGDTLWFERVETCWGNFQEDNNTNDVILDSENCGDKISTKAHTGSTILAFDWEGDQDYDLLLGDISFNNLVLLLNGGTAENAHMTEKNSLFPTLEQATDIHVFPAAYVVDINNDNLQDILVAPNEVKSQSTNQIWHYSNTGTAQNPIFQLQSQNFLTEQMIDVGEGAYPAFVDYNADGLMDFVIGNKGYFNIETQAYAHARLALFENIGTLEIPAFQQVRDDYLGLSEQNFVGIYPTFGDVDGDGDQDMIVGDESGKLHYFENTAGANQVLQLEVHTLGLLNISPLHSSAVPSMADIDGDGKIDLVIGTKKGRIIHYRNFSQAEIDEPLFSLESLQWGDVLIRDPSFAWSSIAPVVTTLDDTDTPYLLVQNEAGNIHLYENLDQEVFDLVTDRYSSIQEGGRGGLAATDLDGDGKKDVLVGNRGGGVALYSQSVVIDNIESNPKIARIEIYPNPCSSNCRLSLEVFPSNVDLQFTLYNIGGQQMNVKNRLIREEQLLEVNVEDLLKGMYFFEVVTGNTRKMGKLLVNTQ